MTSENYFSSPKDQALLQEIAPFKGLIFDLDGTLVDSEPWHFQAWCYALEQCGGPKLAPSDLIDYSGLHSSQVVHDLVERYGLKFSDEQKKALLNLKRSSYLELFMQKVAAFPKILAFLKDQFDLGKKIAVATSSPEAATLFLLKNVGLEPYVRVVLTGDKIKPNKPDPYVYHLAAQKLGLANDECLIVEDSAMGLEGAHNAKMAVLKVAHGDFEYEHIIRPLA